MPTGWFCEKSREFFMTLSFPNNARSYDETRKRVRFLGHDGMFEVRVFVAGEVLGGGIVGRTGNEVDYLASFDALKPRIIKAAQAAYAANRSQTIHLDLDNFR